jgi:aspartyl protease family protein
VNDSTSLIMPVVMIILVASSLFARRIPMGQAAKMGLTWIAVFGTLFVVFSFRPEIKAIWTRVKSDIAGTANQNIVGKAVRLRKDDSGHFSAQIMLNGVPTEFMVDSGASITAITAESAKAAKIDVDRDAMPVLLSTANGRTMGWRASVKTLQLGTINAGDQSVVVMDTLDGTNLLGMNFLNKLRSWKVDGEYMVLEP